MNGRLAPLLHWIFLGAVIASLVWYIGREPQQYEALLALPIAAVALLLGSSLLVLGVLGWHLRVITGVYGVRLRRGEAFHLAASNAFLNYLPAKAGLLARGVYLGVVHSLSAADYLAASVMGQLLSVLASAVVGSALALTLAVSGDNGALLYVAGLLGLATIAVMGAFLASGVLTRIPAPRRLRDFTRRMAKGVALWRHNGQAAAWSLCLALAALILFAARLWIAFAAAGTTPGIMDVLVLQACLGVGFAFSILPGNLGLREGALVTVAVLLGLDPTLSLTAAVLDRVASLVVIVPLGAWATRRLTASAIGKKSCSAHLIGGKNRSSFFRQGRNRANENTPDCRSRLRDH